jgi:hypothetical protein
MTLQDAFEITRPLNLPMSVSRIRSLDEMIDAAVAAGYGLAHHDLFAAQVTLQSLLRGMLSADAAHGQIAAARAALDRMEAALRDGDQA